MVGNLRLFNREKHRVSNSLENRLEFDIVFYLLSLVSLTAEIRAVKLRYGRCIFVKLSPIGVISLRAANVPDICATVLDGNLQIGVAISESFEGVYLPGGGGEDELYRANNLNDGTAADKF